MQKEIVLWGLPKGDYRPFSERILAENCKSLEDVEKVKKIASQDGWHTFRVSVVDLSTSPNFARTLDKTK